MGEVAKQIYVGQDLAIAERTGGMSIAPRNVADVIEFGHLMSTSGHAVPKHLRGNPGACMAVALQAFEWEMSPFAVARKTYLVNDNIAFEAQLIAAVINTRAGLKQRLAIEWHGEDGELFCTVKGEFRDGSSHTYTSPAVGKITTKNSPLWKSDPRQQIAYFSIRSWGRLYAPEVILGVYDRDEMEHVGPDRAKDITPVFDPLSDEPPVDDDGSQDAATDEIKESAVDNTALTGEPASEQETTDQEPSEAAAPAEDAGSGIGEASASSAADPSDAGNGVDEGEVEQSEAEDSPAASSASPALSDEDRAWLKLVAKMLWAATGVGEQDVLRNQFAAIRDNLTPDNIGKLAREKGMSISNRCKLVCFGEKTSTDTLPEIAMIAGCDVKEIV